MRKIIFHLVFLITISAQAQTNSNVLAIDLEAVLQMAGANSKSIEQINLRRQLAKDEYKYAQSWWLPEITAGIAAHQLNGAAMNSDGIFFLDVDRQNFWGGAGITMELDLGAGMSGSTAAKHRMNAANFKSEVERNTWLIQVAQTYMELQGAQMQWQAESLLRDKSKSIVAQMNVQKEAGLIYTSDLLLAKSNFSHYNTSAASLQIKVQQKALQLAAMLNLPLHTQLVVKDSIMAPVDLVDTRVIRIDIASLAEHHPQVKFFENEVLAFDKDRNAIRSSLYLPKLQLGLRGGLFGDIFSPTDRQGNEIDALYNTVEFNGALVWRWPLEELLGRGQANIRKTQLKISRSQYEQSKFNITAEAQAAINQINIAREALRIAEEGLGFAQEALAQSIERQQHRTAEAYEVFQAQSFYKQAQLDVVQAITLYNMGQMRLYVAMGNSL